MSTLGPQEALDTSAPGEWELIGRDTIRTKRTAIGGGYIVAQFWTAPSTEHAAMMMAAPQLLAALKEFLIIAAHCEIKSGVCGCGDSMDNHADPMSAGHAPIDMADQVVNGAIEAAEAAIANAEGRQ